MPNKPKKVKFNAPPGKGEVGVELTFTVDGEADDPGGGAGLRQTGLLLQILYRAGGVPFQQFYKEVVPHNAPAFSKAFKWTPRRAGTYSVRVIAWDNRRKPDSGRDHRTSLTRVKVT